MEQRSSEWAAIAVCTLVIGSLIGVHAASHAQGIKATEADLAKQERLARSEGIPLTPAEFAHPVPDNENAWTFYKQATDLLNQVNKKTNFWQSYNPREIDDPAGVKAIREYLAQAKPALELAAKGAKLGHCDLKLHEAAFDFPALSEFKSIAHVVEVQAGLEIHDGHPNQALDTIATYAPMCGQLGQTHTIVASLVEEAVEEIFFERVIRGTLENRGAEPGIAAAATRAVNAFGPLPDLSLMAEGENLQSLRLLEESVRENKKNPANPPGGESGEFKDVARVSRLEEDPGMVDQWIALQIEATRDYVALFKGAGDNYAELATKSDALEDKLDNPHDDAHAWRSMGSPHWSDVVEIVAYQVSNRRILLQAAKILADASGSKHVFPDKLPLTGEAAHDPFGKAEFHYTHTVTGFTIWGLDLRKRPDPSNPGAPYKPIPGATVSFTYPAKT